MVSPHEDDKADATSNVELEQVEEVFRVKKKAGWGLHLELVSLVKS